VKSKLQNKKSRSIRKETLPMTQLDKANEILVALSVNVTTEDRKAIISEGILAEPYMIKYLKGNGTDLDTAMTLIRFIRKRIADRDLELSGTDQLNVNKKIH
jgi:hypothetical protein